MPSAFQSRLILSNSKDPDLRNSVLETSDDQATKPYFHSSSLGFVLCALFVVGIYAMPFQARASLFSFVGDMISGDKEKTEVVAAPNSQNVPLLQASSESKLAQGGPEITIENAALVADSGPQDSSSEGLAPSEPSDSPIVVYTVKKGDTVSGVAKAFKASETAIVSANDLKRGKPLVEGQSLVILRIPGALYKVKKGDTVGAIAKKFKVPSDEIIEVNGFDNGNSIVAGDEIIIPGVDGGTAALADKKADQKKALAVKEKAPTSPKATAGQAKTEVIPVKTVTAVVADTEEKTQPAVAVKITSAVSLSSYFIRPIEGGRKSQGLHDGNAVDLAAPTGTPIMASADGEVVVARDSGYNGGYGKYIVISHDYNGKTIQTLSAHMTKVSAEVGTKVKQGDIIGYVGSTGRSTGPHVHFEVRGGAKNPGINWD